MAKSKEKIAARELRRKGKSIKDIAHELSISKSSASTWCRDIQLTLLQINVLSAKMLQGSYAGRLKGARMQHERKLEKIKNLYEKARKLVGPLSSRDILLLGVGLYWGEGMKKDGRARIINADPNVIKFMLHWFRSVWKISNTEFTFSVYINEIHKKRVPVVEKYWSELLNIPLSQFTKTILIKSKNKKVYENFENHFGNLTIAIKKGGDLRYLINGLIESVSANIITKSA